MQMLLQCVIAAISVAVFHASAIGETAKVLTVDDLQVVLLPSIPPQALIRAYGTVPSTGWSDGRLVPYVYVTPPADGIYEFDFLAKKPAGVSLPLVSPIKTYHLYPNLGGVRGFRVYASSNDKEVKVDVPESLVAVKGRVAKGFRAAPDLPTAAKEMQAEEGTRIHHHLWHFVRNRRAWDELPAADKAQLAALGWEAPRFDDEPESGLDFLYMHREMIQTMNDKLAEIDDPYWDHVTAWNPIPWSDDDSEWPVPEWIDPLEDAAWARLPSTVRQMERFDELFRDPNWLRTQTLDQLGTAMEFSIHGWMHLRWSAPPPADIESTDVSNDWLFIPWSSHVNKHFWKLHGYIDDRIGDWERATGATADFSGAWAGPAPSPGPTPAVAPHAHEHQADRKLLDFVPSIVNRPVPMLPKVQTIDRLEEEYRALKRMR